MEALGHMVLEKKIFYVFFLIVSLREHLTPRAGAISDPRGMLDRIYVKLHITMLHTKYRSIGFCCFREEDIFHVFSIVSLWQIKMPPSGACMHPRATVSRIYKEDPNTLLHTKYESSGPCGFVEEDFLCFSHDPPPPPPQGGACMDPSGTVGRIYKEDHYTLLHKKYESSGHCGGGEDFLCCFFFHCMSMGAPGRAIFHSRGTVGRIR